MNQKQQNAKYNYDNVFWRIILREVKTFFEYENENTLIFKDINPRARVHFLAIPKTPCIDFYDFMNRSSEEEIFAYYNGINEFIKSKKLFLDGFKIVSNNGKDNGQEIMHFHTHIMQL